MRDPEAALELAVLALGEVCREGTADERVTAATVLVQAVKEERDWKRKCALSAVFVPLLQTLSGNLAGNLDEDHPYGPVLGLTAVEQGNLLLQLTKVTEL